MIGASSVVIVAIIVTVAFLLGRSSAAPGPSPTRVSPITLPASTPTLDEAKAKDVRITVCKALPEGGGHAEGVIKNSAKTARRYDLTVYFEKDGQPVSYATAWVEVPAGGTVPFVAERAFHYPGGLSCVMAGVQ